jgi:hypothetical protein
MTREVNTSLNAAERVLVARDGTYTLPGRSILNRPWMLIRSLRNSYTVYFTETAIL